MPDYQPGDSNHHELDPAVKDSVDRLRNISKSLQNGSSADTGAIGRAVGDIGFLVANIVESQPPTRRKCDDNRRDMHEKMERRIADVEKKASARGINMPTALTIITAIGVFGGVIVKLLD